MSTDHAASLKALQLCGMTTAWGELQAEKPKQAHRPESWMDRLIAAEQTERQTHVAGNFCDRLLLY